MGAAGGAQPTISTDLALPVLLSFIAGSATTLGGLVVTCVSDTPSDATVSGVLAYAAGVMITVSVADLWLPQALGGIAPAMWATFFAALGALSCRALALIRIPEPEDVAASFRGAWGRARGGSELSGGESGGGGSGGGGAGTSLALDGLLPGGHGKPPRDRRAAWRLGALLAIVLTLHNLPEGVAVGVGAVKSKELGLVLCASIFAHNVAEGFVVAIPVLAGTGDRRFALALTALSVSGLGSPGGRWRWGLPGAPRARAEGPRLRCIPLVHVDAIASSTPPPPRITRDPSGAVRAAGRAPGRAATALRRAARHRRRH